MHLPVQHRCSRSDHIALIVQQFNTQSRYAGFCAVDDAVFAKSNQVIPLILLLWVTLQRHRLFGGGGQSNQLADPYIYGAFCIAVAVIRSGIGIGKLQRVSNIKSDIIISRSKSRKTILPIYIRGGLIRKLKSTSVNSTLMSFFIPDSPTPNKPSASSSSNTLPQIGLGFVYKNPNQGQLYHRLIAR